jgi:hypothetical protein
MLNVRATLVLHLSIGRFLRSSAAARQSQTAELAGPAIVSAAP